MTKWEYVAQTADQMRIDPGLQRGNNLEKMLDSKGISGWELVAVDHGIRYFKREVTHDA